MTFGLPLHPLINTSPVIHARLTKVKFLTSTAATVGHQRKMLLNQVEVSAETIRKKVLATTESTRGPNRGLAGSMRVMARKLTYSSYGHLMVMLTVFVPASHLVTLKKELNRIPAQMAPRLAHASQSHQQENASKLLTIWKATLPALISTSARLIGTLGIAVMKRELMLQTWKSGWKMTWEHGMKVTQLIHKKWRAMTKSTPTGSTTAIHSSTIQSGLLR